VKGAFFMPSNFTPNYNLNQWEPDDRVLRTDFNADNAKIDAALANMIGRPEFIAKWSAGKDTSMSVGWMKNDFDWNLWDYIAITLQYPRGEELSADMLVYTAKFTQMMPAVPFSDALLVFFSKHDDTRPIQGIYLGKEPGFFHLDDLTFREFDYLDIATISPKRMYSPLLKVYGGK